MSTKNQNVYLSDNDNVSKDEGALDKEQLGMPFKTNYSTKSELEADSEAISIPDNSVKVNACTSVRDKESEPRVVIGEKDIQYDNSACSMMGIMTPEENENRGEQVDSICQGQHHETVNMSTSEKVVKQVKHDGTESKETKQVETGEDIKQKKKEALANLKSKKTHDEYGESYEHPLKVQYNKAKKKFTFFWKSDSVFSQWYPSKFKSKGKEFTCAEQYMMYTKAVFFESDGIAKEILKTSSPRKMKALGRQVEQFKDNVWVWHCLYVVREASVLKFRQNPKMQEALFSTYPTVLVEASPYDKLWGIGVDERDERAWNKETWEGLNLLGYILTEVRDELMCMANIIKDHNRKIYVPELQDTLFKQNLHCFPGTPID